MTETTQQHKLTDAERLTLCEEHLAHLNGMHGDLLHISKQHADMIRVIAKKVRLDESIARIDASLAKARNKFVWWLIIVIGAVALLIWRQS